MLQFRTGFLVWLLAGALALGTGAVLAQDDNKAEEAPQANEEKPAAWPPADAEKHEIKRNDQRHGLMLYTPKTWKKGQPGNTLRLAEFSIPPAEGDKEPVELTIFSFGSGGGGGIQANVDRWINQFQSDGRKVKITKAEGHQGLYVYVDLQGTYNMPDGPPILQKTKPLPNARMLGVIIGIRWEEAGEAGDVPEKKSSVYFLKLAGPEKTVTANEKAFRQAFGAANPDKEEPLEVKEEPAE
jgi:hypothetical protein